MSMTQALLSDVLKPIDEDLQQVGARLAAWLQDPIAERSSYLIQAGGKRLRPALVLLAGRSGDAVRHREGLIELAAAVELIHTATLIHDDIIDAAAMRRKQPTFHQRFGTERAVLMGDYLYAAAFAMVAALRHDGVTACLAEICQQMSRGEFLEVEARYRVDLTEAEYLAVIRDKTASLIAASCRTGALLAGAPPASVERLTTFGWNMGMAFQIMDDCLDLIGEEELVGKLLRSDLEKGSLSLPIIRLASSLAPEARQELFGPLLRRSPDEAFLARVAREAVGRGAVQQAMKIAERYIEEAHRAVDDPDDLAMGEAYRSLARYAIERAQ